MTHLFESAIPWTGDAVTFPLGAIIAVGATNLLSHPFSSARYYKLFITTRNVAKLLTSYFNLLLSPSTDTLICLSPTMHFIGRVTMLFANNSLMECLITMKFLHIFLHPDVIFS